MGVMGCEESIREEGEGGGGGCERLYSHYALLYIHSCRRRHWNSPSLPEICPNNYNRVYNTTESTTQL